MFTFLFSTTLKAKVSGVIWGTVYDVRYLPGSTGIQIPGSSSDVTSYFNTQFIPQVLVDMQTRINNNETNFTIVFPNRVYEISGEPLTGGLKFNFTSLLLKNDNNTPGAKIPIQINFIGYKTLPSSEITNISTGDIPTTNMTCNYNPTSTDFLSTVNNYSDFPQLHSNYKDDFNAWHHHDFLEIIAQVEDEQYWKSVNVMGLYIRGENPEYDPYHPFFDKQLGTYGIHIRHAREFFVDNNVIDNIYGGAIKLRSGQEDINTENKSLPSTIERNIITNCWGNNPRMSCDCSLGNCTIDDYGCGYDNYGDGIECDALDKALIQYNFIKNDLAVTKQLSRAGITLQWASGCTVQYNFVHGYDRNFHIEITRYKSHTLKYNRSTGSLLSLWDGEEDPDGYDFYTPPNIMYNYFSTTGMIPPLTGTGIGCNWNNNHTHTNPNNTTYIAEDYVDDNDDDMIKFVLDPTPSQKPKGLMPILSVKYPFITTTNGLSTAEILNNLNFRNNLIEINESDYSGWYRDYGSSSNSSRVTSIFSGSTNVKEVVFKCNTVKVVNSHGDFLALNHSGTFHTVSGNTFDGTFRNSGSTNQHICFPSSPTSTILSCNDFSNVSPANSQNNYNVNLCSPVTDNCANHQHLLLAPPLVTNISCGDIASGSNDGSIFFDQIGPSGLFTFTMTYINGTTLVTQTNTTGLFQNLSAINYAINVSITGSSLSQSFNVTIQAPDPVFCNCTGAEATNNKPNIQLWMSPYASDLDLENQGPIIFAKDYFIDGVFSIDKNITFVDCSFYFTPGSSIVIDHNYKLALLGCDLQSGCNEMWDGIYADHPSEEIFIAGSLFQDMETGIHIMNNAKITSLDSKYQDNRYGINLINLNSAAKCKIERNTFMRKSGLIAPYALEVKPKCGMNIMNCDDINIGNYPYPSSGNIFKDVWNGIYITETSSKTWTNPNANIYLNHNHFYDIVGNGPLYGAGILNDANGWGIYAYKSILNAHLTVRVKGDGINGDTDDHFKRCDRGIMLRRVAGDIVNNRMSNMVIGIMAVECPGQHYKISGNKIDLVHLGIYKSGDESNQGNYVAGNLIKLKLNPNIPINGFYNGLRPAAIVSNYSSISNIGNTVIYSNQIDMLDENKATGISLNRGSNDHVVGNQIHFLSQTSDNTLAIPNLIGINSNGNDRVNVSGNLIDNGFYSNSSVTYVPGNNAGLYLTANPNSLVSCNNANFLKYGLFAVGANGNSTDYKRTTSNIMNCSDADFIFWKLAVEGSMGQIGIYDPLLSLAYDANNTFLDPSGVITGAAPIALNRVFRVTDCSTNFSDEIVTDAGKLVQSQSTASNSNSNICRPYVSNPPSFTDAHICNELTDPFPDPVVTVDHPKDIDLLHALKVAGDSISYEDFPEGARRSDEELIFAWLRDQDSLRTSNTILDSFYLSTHIDIVGSLSNVDLQISKLSDSTLMADSVAWHNQLTMAKQGNNALGNSDIFEANAKWINGLYLRVLEFALDSLTNEEIEDIGVVANTCPYVGGNAVYRARVLFSYFVPGIHYDELELCNGQGVYKNGESKLQQQLNSIKDYKNNKTQVLNGIGVYPVPTDAQLNIAYHFSVGESGVFTMFDLLGRKHLQTELSDQRTKVSLNVAYLPAGIYMYHVQTNRNTLYSGKIIIE